MQRACARVVRMTRESRNSKSPDGSRKQPKKRGRPLTVQRGKSWRKHRKPRGEEAKEMTVPLNASPRRRRQIWTAAEKLESERFSDLFPYNSNRINGIP
jgi:hypothetical protein